MTGTELPFSTSGAMSNSTRPVRTGAPPLNWAMAARRSSGAASDGRVMIVPTPPITTDRRSIRVGANWGV
jgi:hypothetical protein